MYRPIQRARSAAQGALRRLRSRGGDAAPAGMRQDEVGGVAMLEAEPGALLPPTSAPIRARDLADPESVASEFTPADYADAQEKAERERQAAWQQARQEEIVCQFVKAEQKRAADRRSYQEREWALSRAFYESRQWLAFDDNTNRLISLVNEDEKDRYVTANLIAPLTDKVASLATMSQPDANAAPLTTAKKDRAAAAAGRAITADCDRRFDRPAQTKQRVNWALTTTTVFLKLWWDASAPCLVPVFDPQSGDIVEAKTAPEGQICEEVCPGFEVFLDPTCTDPDAAQWLHHVKLRPLSYFIEKYGEKGKRVEPDAMNGDAGYLDAYLLGDGWGSGGGRQSGTGGAFTAPGVAGMDRQSGSDTRAAYCVERWEKPSPRYPKGRYLVTAGNVLLEYREECPYLRYDGNQWCLPFVPLGYRKVAGSAYCASLVQEAVSLQMCYNRLLSALIEQAESQVDYVGIPTGAQVGGDFMDRIRKSRARIPVPHTPGLPPTFSRTPGISSENINLLNLTYERLQDVFGVHDASTGKPQGGSTTGIAIELLQQGDERLLALFVAEIEKSMVCIKEWEIWFFEKFATPDRLIGLDDTGNPEQARANMEALRALSEGGQTRIHLNPGSAMPKSSAGIKQEAIELYQLGVYGPPGTPQAAKTLVRAMQLGDSDRLLDAIDLWEQQDAQEAMAQAAIAEEEQMQVQAAQADAMQMQAAQMRQAEQMAAMQQEADAARDVAKEQERARAQMAVDASRAQVEVEKAAEEAAITLRADVLRNRLIPPEPSRQGRDTPKTTATTSKKPAPRKG